MNNINVIPKLKIVIENLIINLQRYAQKENANQAYIDIQNKLISDLVEINNRYFGLKYFDVWQKAENKILELEKIDSSLNSHHIVLLKGNSESRSSLIKISLTDL